jgi:membrane protein
VARRDWHESVSGFVIRTLQGADENHVPFFASAITFDALLAAIPFALLLLVGLTHAARLSAADSPGELSAILDRFLPQHDTTPGHDPFATVEALLVRVTRSRGTISLYALPLFLWFSTRLFSSIRTALNEIFDVSVHAPRRHFVVAYLVGKLRDAGMVLATLLLLLANTVLTAGVAYIGARSAAAASHSPFAGFTATAVGRLLTQLLSFVFALSLFFLLYKFASIRRLPWRAALLASTVTAVMYELAKRLFGWYLRVALVHSMSPDANIGALILFVVWVYYTAVVFLIGGVIADTWELRVRQRRQEAVLA